MPCQRPVLIMLLSDGGMLAYSAFRCPIGLRFSRLQLDWIGHSDGRGAHGVCSRVTRFDGLGEGKRTYRQGTNSRLEHRNSPCLSTSHFFLEASRCTSPRQVRPFIGQEQLKTACGGEWLAEVLNPRVAVGAGVAQIFPCIYF